ncbi:MAG: GAF domain-containing protein, partial [Acidimicrobiales bacterium]|nr:GAF domain-containing protein [Acidimicrobiales bacterium]
HAVWSPAIGQPLQPLGSLFGDEAITHGELASSLFRMFCAGSDGSPLTAAALQEGGPVWMPAIPRVGWKGIGRMLRAHTVKSGGAFPFIIDSRVVAVVELLSFEPLACDLASNALAEELAPMIASRYRTLNLS